MNNKMKVLKISLIFMLVSMLVIFLMPALSFASTLPNSLVWGRQGADDDPECDKIGDGPYRTADGWIHWVVTQASGVTDAELVLGGSGGGYTVNFPVDDRAYKPEGPVGPMIHFFPPYFDVNTLTATLYYAGTLGGNPQFNISDYCLGIDSDLGIISISKNGLEEGDTATFSLYKADGTKVGSDLVLGNETKSWPNLVFGEYYVVETVPAGYGNPTWEYNGIEGTGNRIPAGTGLLTIDEQILNITINVTNTPTTPDTGSITIQKAGLGAGVTATFTLYNTGGQVQQPINLTSDNTSDGWNNLDPGNYYVVETVPGGYQTPSWTIGPPVDVSGTGNRIPEGIDTIMIGEESLSININVTNTPDDPPPPPTGAIQIFKTIPVQEDNVTFTFTVSPAVNGVSSFEVTVPAGSEQGSTTIPNVSFGDYAVVEVSLGGWTLDNSEGTEFTLTAATGLATPAFWNLPDEPPTVAVAGIQEEAIVEVLAITEELPYTGYNWLFAVAGLVLVAMGGTILGLRIKPKKETS